ncbi:uncharacterized protein [Macaca fascicularis]|uniref:uncharacterized protein n=1 Tax=Macaca fascicularis TaxID=9541 RepID=UPI003D1542A8
MRRPLPPTATLACARASPRPLPRYTRGERSSSIHRLAEPRATAGRHSSSRAAAAHAGAGSHIGVGRPLPPEGRRLSGARADPGSREESRLLRMPCSLQRWERTGPCQLSRLP